MGDFGNCKNEWHCCLNDRVCVGMVLRRCVKLVFVRQKEVQGSEVSHNNVSVAFDKKNR